MFENALNLKPQMKWVLHKRPLGTFYVILNTTMNQYQSISFSHFEKKLKISSGLLLGFLRLT